MKEYKSREVVLAEKYLGQHIEGIKIGKNDPNNRWDDTPDGPYIQGREYKHRVHNGDWVVKYDGNIVSDKFLTVMSDAEFNKRYKLKKNA